VVLALSSSTIRSCSLARHCCGFDVGGLGVAALDRRIGVDARGEQGPVGVGSCGVEHGAGVLAGVLQTLGGVAPELLGLALGCRHGFVGDALGVVEHVEGGSFGRLVSGQFALHPADVFGDAFEVAVDLDGVVPLPPPAGEAVGDDLVRVNCRMVVAPGSWSVMWVWRVATGWGGR
jgi:hypothetical protein